MELGAWVWGAVAVFMAGCNGGTTMHDDGAVDGARDGLVLADALGDVTVDAPSDATVDVPNDATADVAMDGATDAGPADSGPPRITQVVLGSLDGAALRSDGTVWAWGISDFGQLGPAAPLSTCTVGTITNPCSNTAVRIMGVSGATQIAAGSGHFCALLGTGDVTCWGENDGGQLGNGSQDQVPHPTPARVSLSGPAAQIAAGAFVTCALLRDGTTWCWGSNDNGQVGLPIAGPSTCSITDPVTGPETHACAPTPVHVTGLANVAQLSLGRSASCARSTTGGVTCWGLNERGQRGIGALSIVADPARMPIALMGTATQISEGGSHGCAVLADTTARCWGWNDLGQLALTTAQAMQCMDDNGATFECEPVPHPLPVLTGIAGIASGRMHTCAVLTAGTVYCFGRNDDNEAGIDTTPATVCMGDQPYNCLRAPTQVMNLPVAATSVAAGDFHSCAVMTDGTARCWGRNDFGQLGNGTMIAGASPTLVTGL